MKRYFNNFFHYMSLVSECFDNLKLKPGHHPTKPHLQGGIILLNLAHPQKDLANFDKKK